MSEPPPEFVCPVTHEVLEDPVIASDGITYEREVLERVVALAIAEGSAPRLPSSRIRFRLDGLIPNLALRDSIKRWREENLDHFLPDASPARPLPPPPPLEPAAPSPPRPMHIVIVFEASKRFLSERPLYADVLQDITNTIGALSSSSRVSLVSYGAHGNILQKHARPRRDTSQNAFEMLYYDVRVNLADGINKGILCMHELQEDLASIMIVLSFSKPTKGPPPEFIIQNAHIRPSAIIPIMLSEEALQQRWFTSTVDWNGVGTILQALHLHRFLQ